MGVKSSNPIAAMTINESLGDIPTHVMKSGSCFRPKEDLNRLAQFKERIIPKRYRGLPFEYDLWFNTDERFVLRSWLYTDFLGNGIYIRVPSVPSNHNLLHTIAIRETKIDWDRIEKIKNNLHNKYILQASPEYHDKVIFPPGSNLMNKNIISWKRMREHVDRGFKVKPHPITAHVWIAKLKKELGAENILGKKEGGFELLMNCKEAAICPNSEMGIIALLLDKQLSLVSTPYDVRKKNPLTYESIYYAISAKGIKSSKDALLKIMSSKRSGIIFDFDEDAEERMYLYLENFWDYNIK